jgi:hypothetical protein
MESNKTPLASGGAEIEGCAKVSFDKVAGVPAICVH